MLNLRAVSQLKVEFKFLNLKVKLFLQILDFNSSSIHWAKTELLFFAQLMILITFMSCNSHEVQKERSAPFKKRETTIFGCQGKK